MDAASLDLTAPIPDLRVHMEHHRAFCVRLLGPFDDLEFLASCADLITTLHLPGSPVQSSSALASLMRVRELYRPPANADVLLPNLPRLRRLTLFGQHDLSVLEQCAELRELALGVYLEDHLPDPGSPTISPKQLPPLSQLQMLSIGGTGITSLDGIERFTSLRTLQLINVMLRDSAGGEYLADRFGADIQEFTARNKGDERRLSRVHTRLDSDRVAFERASIVVPTNQTTNSAHPACVLLLLDRSRSTEQPIGLDLRVISDAAAEKHHVSQRYGKGPDGDKRHCDAWTDAINRFLDRFCSRVPPSLRDHVAVGVIEYGERIGWAWSGALAGRTIVPVAELDAHPSRISPSRTWLDPVAAGETPLGEAMEMAHGALTEWLARHPHGLPPVIVSIGSGRVTGDDLRRHGWALRRLRTSIGHAVLCHLERDGMFGLPHFGVEGYTSSTNELFSQASPLPLHLVDSVRSAGYPFLGHPRGYFKDPTEADVENLLHVFTAFPGLDWSAELVRHPLPPHAITEEDVARWPSSASGTERKAKPWKVPKIRRPMTEELFWTVIEKSRKGVSDTEEQLDRLAMLLDQLDEDDLVAWERILQSKIAEAYRWDLWAVAFIAMDGCSDDGFVDFRAWLVAQGRAFFEATLAKPEHAARRIEPGDEAALEELTALAARAYESKTSRTDFDDRVDADHPAEPAGDEWKEEDLPRLYPKLVRKYGG